MAKKCLMTYLIVMLCLILCFCILVSCRQETTKEKTAENADYLVEYSGTLHEASRNGCYISVFFLKAPIEGTVLLYRCKVTMEKDDGSIVEGYGKFRDEQTANDGGYGFETVSSGPIGAFSLIDCRFEKKDLMSSEHLIFRIEYNSDCFVYHAFKNSDLGLI